MAQTRKALTTSASLLCPAPTRTTSIFCTDDTHLSTDVLFCQATPMVRYIHVYASLLPGVSLLYRSGRSARVSQGPQTQMELARGTVYDASFFPLPVYAEY